MELVSHALSTDDHFINDTLAEIPELVPASKRPWRPLESSTGLFQPDSSVPEREGHPLMTLRPRFLALDENKEPLPDLSRLSGSTSSSAAEDWGSVKEFDAPAENLADIWSNEDIIHPPRLKQLLSWDSFRNPLATKPGPIYLSESGQVTFDAALELEATKRGSKRPDRTVSRDDFLHSLMETAVGRESLLYHYDSETSQFVPILDDYRLSGISMDVQESLLDDVVTMGNCVRHLEEFLAKPNLQPVLIALASAVSSILCATKTKLDELKIDILTPLQLQHLFSRPMSLLHSLEALVQVNKTGQQGPELMFKLIQKSEDLCVSESWLGPLLHTILQRSSVPYLRNISRRVGLDYQHSYSLERSSASSKNVALGMESTQSRKYFPGPFQDLISECERCLNVCRHEQIETPIFDRTGGKTADLAWQSTWEQVFIAQNDASEHETTLMKRIFNGPETTSGDQAISGHDDIAACPLEGTLIDIDGRRLTGHYLSATSQAELSSLYKLVVAALNPECETLDSLSLGLYPPISQTLSLSVRPLLIAQSRLLSFYTLRILLRNHELRTHLSALYRFQLLADGTFASRLSQALFDGDLSSSDGRRIGEGTTGLRLQTRDTWPPASSELRLALMGILNESYQNEPRAGGGEQGEQGKQGDLPGSLSFAIRELSSEELECCRDPNDVGALDFLRMQYKPAAALGHIITDKCLQKYDSTFRFMLRLLRMRAVTQSLLRHVTGKDSPTDHTTQKLRIEMHYFINSLVAYIYHDAIEASWTRFQQLLATVENDIDGQDYDGTLLRAKNLSWLQNLHETVLDRILFGLFLGGGQSGATNAICAIFGLILRFSSFVRRDSHSHSSEIKGMHEEFSIQMKSFLRYLRSQKGSRTKSASGQIDSESILGENVSYDTLLIKLDFCGYYS